MDNFKAVKLLCKAEHILNIHRDYLFMTRKKRISITCIILLDVIICITICIDNLKIITKSLGDISQLSLYYSTVVFHILHVFQNVLIVLYFGPRFGGNFKELLSILSHSHHSVQHYAPYRRVLEQLNIRYLCAIFVLGIVRILIMAQVVANIMNNNRASFSSFIFLFMRTLFQVRYLMGILLYCCLLDIIRSILQTVRELVREASNDSSLQDNVDNFVSVYRHLLDSRQQLKKCLGHQVSTYSQRK